jgi:hypothetical protein
MLTFAGNGAIEDRQEDERTGVALMRIPCKSARAAVETRANVGYFGDYPDA